MARAASGRSGSSSRWLREHESDDYVQRARREGYRSRAVYKLDELDRKDGLFRPGMRVVDLGAAPGAWSQLAAERVGPGGQVVGLDILPMEALAGVTLLQGDFTEQAVLDELLAILGGEPVDIVLSDMAPNMSGVKAVDQPASMNLVELAWDLAERTLKPGGDFVTKAFQGEGFDPFRDTLRRRFDTVKIRKPEASRNRSPEIYVVARNFVVV